MTVSLDYLSSAYATYHPYQDKVRRDSELRVYLLGAIPISFWVNLQELLEDYTETYSYREEDLMEILAQLEKEKLVEVSYVNEVVFYQLTLEGYKYWGDLWSKDDWNARI